MELSEREELELLELEERESKGKSSIPQPKSFGSNIVDSFSNAVSQTPLGMVAQGTNSAMEGIGKAFTPIIPAPQSVRNAVSPIFRGSRAIGVGTARLMTGPKTGQGGLDAFKRSMEAYKPDFKPAGAVESIGATLGEQVPVLAATALSPVVGGPISFAAQQISDTGKFSPVPAALSIASSPILKSVKNKALSYVGDVPEESINYKIEHPQSVQRAKDISEIASKDVPRIANKFDQAIEGLKSEAKKTLSTSRFLEITSTDRGGAFTKDEVLGAITTAKRKLGGVYTPEAEGASRVLSKVRGHLEKTRNTVSQNQVADLIDDLDREIPWDKVWRKPEDLTLTDKALIDTRTKLDGILKKKNKVYAKVMAPLSEQIQTRNEFLKTMNLQKVRGEGYQPSDTTASRLFGATKENRLMTKRVLGKTKEALGENLEPDIRAAQVKADFEPESSRSYRGGEIGARQTLGRPLVDKLTNVKGPGIPVGPASYLTEEEARRFWEQAKREGLIGEEAKLRARQLAKDAGFKWKR